METTPSECCCPSCNLQSYSPTGNDDFPKFSKAEVEDKSKGDAVQSSRHPANWLICDVVHRPIARVVQRLPTTELELVIVTFAALNFVIYLLWHKLVNVRRGARVYN